MKQRKDKMKNHYNSYGKISNDLRYYSSDWSLRRLKAKKEGRNIWRHNEQIFYSMDKNYQLGNSKTIPNSNHTIIRKLKSKNILNKRLKKIMNGKCLKQTGKKQQIQMNKSKISCFSLKNTIKKKDIAKFSLNLGKSNLSS